MRTSPHQVGLAEQEIDHRFTDHRRRRPPRQPGPPRKPRAPGKRPGTRPPRPSIARSPSALARGPPPALPGGRAGAVRAASPVTSSACLRPTPPRPRGADAADVRGVVGAGPTRRWVGAGRWAVRGRGGCALRRRPRFLLGGFVWFWIDFAERSLPDSIFPNRPTYFLWFPQSKVL